MTSGQAPGWWPHWRRFLDRVATAVITGGGGFVLVTIVMLFAFLIYEIAPLLQPATLATLDDMSGWDQRKPNSLLLSTGEYGDVVFRLSEDGVGSFRDRTSGEMLARYELGQGAEITSVARSAPGGGGIALGFADGSLLALRESFRPVFDDSARQLIPQLDFPLGEIPLRPGAERPIVTLGLGEDAALLVAQDDAGRVLMLDGATGVVHDLGRWPVAASLHVGEDNRWVLLLDHMGSYVLWTLANGPPSAPVQGRLSRKVSV